MAVTPGQIPVPGTAEILDTTLVTVGGDSVHREVVVLADPENPDVYVRPTTAGAIPVVMADSAQLDAFGRLRVSQPTTLFESVQRYGDDLLKWETALAGTGSSTASAADNAVIMSTGGTANGASCIRQTRRQFRYQAGKSLVAEMTFVLGTAYTNCVQAVGYFDANNGIFLRRSGTAVTLVLRSDTSGVASDTSIAKASWNVDPMDGTGPSGVTLDLTKAQILFIDLQYLGVGRVRVGFVVGGIPYVAHEFRNANSVTTVYMRSATLPIRYAIYNSGTGGGVGSLYHICSAVYVEGGAVSGPTKPFTHNNGTTAISVTTRRPVLSIRAKTTGPNSVRNIGEIVPSNFHVTAATNGSLFEIVLNGTLTGASWSAVDASYSLAEKDVSATAISGGIVIGSGYALAGSGSIHNGLNDEFARDLALIYSSLGNVQDTLSIVCTSLSGTSSVLAAVDWDESGV